MSTPAAIASQLSLTLEETAALCVELAEQINNQSLGQKFFQQLEQCNAQMAALRPLFQAQHHSHAGQTWIAVAITRINNPTFQTSMQAAESAMKESVAKVIAEFEKESAFRGLSLVQLSRSIHRQAVLVGQLAAVLW